MPGLKEKPTYKIFVLDDDEYLGLHKYVPEVKEEDLNNSFGFANPKTNEAYVRRTRCKEMDDETILHEAQELLLKVSPHEEDGIRWKKFTEVLSSIVSPIVGAIATLTGHPYVGALLSAGLSTPAAVRGETAPYTPVIAGGANLLGGALGVGKAGGEAFNQAVSKGTGFIGSTGQSLKAGVGSLLGMTPTTTTSTISPGTQVATALGKPVTFGQTIQSASPSALTSAITSGFPISETQKTLPITSGISPIEKGYVETVKSTSPYGQYGNPSSGYFGGQQPITGSEVSGALQTGRTVANNILGSAIGTGIGSQLASAVKATPPASSPAITPVTPTSSNIFSTLGKKAGDYLSQPQNLLGAGMIGASMLPKSQPYPEIDIEGIRSSLLSGQGISPLAQQARAQLSQILSARPQDLYQTATDAYYQSAFRQIEKSYADAQKAMAQRYNLIDPNYMQNGEYQELARRLDAELANVKSDYATQEEQRRFELSRNQQYESIKTALAVDDATMKDLIGLTGLSITQASAKYQVQENDVNEIRKALGGLGGQLLTSGMQSGSGLTINMGGAQ